MLYVRLMMLWALTAAPVVAGDGGKPPAWNLTIEERIAARLQHHSGPPSSSGEASLAAGPASFVIDGSRDPELLMPWELMNVLLRGVSGNSAYQDDVRSQYKDGIIAAGWKPDEFWVAIEEAGTSFIPVARKSRTLLALAATAAPAERPEHERDVQALRIPYCSARVEALRLARAHFGRERFDRFLYTVIAPTMTVSGSVSEETDAARLRFIEGGCR